MERNIRLVAGGAALVAGVLLLLVNLHIVDAHELRRYWPATLIIVGFAKLIADRGRARSPFAGNRPLFADSPEAFRR
jgi:Domain of unknown function (DUF5668)